MGRRSGSGQRWRGLVVGLFGLMLALSGSAYGAASSKGKASSATVKKPTPAAAASGEVTFAGENGLELRGLYFPGKPKGMGVVLIHMDGRSGEDWKHFGEKLGKNGVHALALDLRGHGQSVRMAGGKTLTYDQLDEAQYQAMTRDIAAAVGYLRTKTTVDPNQIALIGASIGANLAIRYAAEDNKISNVILLSPGLEYKGVTAEDAVTRYGERPLFIAVSREDNFSAKSSLVLESMARGKKYLQVYTGAGHGTKMMSREPGLETTMTSWLNGTLVTEGVDEPGPRPPALSR